MKTRMKNIIEKLNKASDAYYNGEAELMTNAEWDALFDELTRLENESGIILPESPTHKVSEDVIRGKKVEHRFPALSLAKTKDVNELIKWANKKDVWMSYKLDGLTLVATYSAISKEEAVLFSLVTRGNGLIGTDVTHLAPYIKGVPMKIPYGHNMVVRGEALISYKDFEEVNVNNAFANPRNMASGSLTLLDMEEFQKRRIHFVAFTLVHTTQEINSWGDRMDLLETLGFEVVERKKCNINEIEKTVDFFTNKVESGECKYPVDGLVIAYDDVKYAEEGSVTGHHATRGGLAFKWADEETESTLLNIDWSCSVKTITPVAVFEPVEILGTTVQRASLHNVSECRRLNIGSKGTRISIIKANMIIPQITKVIEKVGELEIPAVCPVCNGKTEVIKSESGTETLICTNKDCTAKNLSKFTRFVSRDGMNIDGLSESTLQTFINEGFIDNYADIFNLKHYAEDIMSLDGFGKKSVENLIKALAKATTVESNKFLYALNIPLCGKDVSKRLMERYTLDEFIELVDKTDDELFLSSLENFGKEKSSSIYNWFKENMEFVKDFKETLNIVDIKSEKTEGPCTGYTFVITGELHSYKNREELKEYIEKQGGKVSGSVSGKTSYLINNDIMSNSGKNKKAKSLGIEIITEEDFIKRFGVK